MRILHVHSGNIFGGVERILLALAQHRAISPGFEHTFALCFRDRLAAELPAGQLLFLPTVHLSRPWEVLRARKALRKSIAAHEKFDLAIVHSAWAHSIFASALRHAELPLIFWLHTVARGETLLERAAQRHPPDQVISVSQIVDESARRLFPGVPSEVVFSPLAIDRDAFNAADRAPTRQQIGAGENEVVILQASRMEAWKGHRQLLGALAALLKIPNWTCWIAGGAERDEEAVYMESIQEIARKNGLANRVKFLGCRNDVPALLKAADIYCQPNLEGEGFSIVFVEAFYAGLPIVTSAIGGALEIVDQECGMLVPPNDPPALAAALEKLICSPETRRRLGEAGRQRVLERCNPERQFASLEKVFLKTIAAHG